MKLYWNVVFSESFNRLPKPDSTPLDFVAELLERLAYVEGRY